MIGMESRAWEVTRSRHHLGLSLPLTRNGSGSHRRLLASPQGGGAAHPAWVRFRFRLRGRRAFSVESLDADTSSRESADQATWYTGPTWPRSVATNAPRTPSHSLTALSNDALTTQRPSGENCTCKRDMEAHQVLMTMPRTPSQT